MRDYGLFDSNAPEDDPATSASGGGVFDIDSSSEQLPKNGNQELFTDASATHDLESEFDNVNHPPASDIDPDDDAKRTIYMTTLFVVLMVLYVGFCFWYRRGKGRRTVGLDGEEGALDDEDRRRQRRENQSVLDESTNAASRARENAEEQAKLEQRKSNIKKALLLRLIVDEDEESTNNEGDVEQGNGKKIVECVNTKGCDCEHCQYWKWDSNQEAAEGSKSKVAEGGGEQQVSNNVDLSLPMKRGIITIQEEDSDAENEQEDVDLDEAIARAQDDMMNADDIEAQNAIYKEADANTAIASNDEENENDIEAQNAKSDKGVCNTTEPASSANTTASSPRASSSYMLNPPLSPSRLSLSSPRKYTDALLNCGSNSRINCSGSNTITCNNLNSTNCGNMSAKACGSIHGRLGKCGASGDTPTISLSSILGMYGEECNICLSSFQVGDRAAWSKLHSNTSSDDKSNDDPTGNERDQDASSAAAVGNEMSGNVNESVQREAKSEEETNGCTHVFHEECISRWLLVRDGCPICRRSYFPDAENGNANRGSEDTMDTSTATTASASASSTSTNAANNTNDSGEEVDVELGTRSRSRSNRGQGSRVDLTGSWW